MFEITNQLTDCLKFEIWKLEFIWKLSFEIWSFVLSRHHLDSGLKIVGIASLKRVGMRIVDCWLLGNPDRVWNPVKTVEKALPLSFRGFFWWPRNLGKGLPNTLNKHGFKLYYPTPDSSPDKKIRDQNDNFFDLFRQPCQDFFNRKK